MNGKRLGIFTTVLVSACLVWWFSRPLPVAAPQPLAERLDGHVALLPQTPLVSRAFPVTVDAELVAEREATLSAAVDGELHEIRAGSDERVAEGEVLAVIASAQLLQKRLENESRVQELSAMLQLHSPTSNPELRKLKAAMEAGKKRYRYAETSFERLAELFRRGLVSGKEHEDASVQLEADRLALEAAHRDLADAQTMSSASFIKINNQLQVARIEQRQLRDSMAELTLRAPFAGRVRRYAPPRTHSRDEWLSGDAIKAGEPLFYLETANRMVRVDAGKQTLEQFAVGDTVTVTSSDGKDSQQGVVHRIVRAAHEAGASSAVEALAQIRIALPPGAFAAAKNRRVRVSKVVLQQGRAVPIEVLSSLGSEQFVYVKRCTDPSLSVTRRRVVASAEDGGMALITAGLSADECIADIKVPSS